MTALKGIGKYSFNQALASIYRNRWFFVEKNLNSSPGARTCQTTYSIFRFPQSFQSTSFSPAVNTSHIQGTEEELNYSELNLGCIISNYKLSRILFILIKSVQLLMCIQFVWQFHQYFLRAQRENRRCTVCTKQKKGSVYILIKAEDTVKNNTWLALNLFGET